MVRRLLITGGAGFIGSAVVRMAIDEGHYVINVDALTYAGCLDNVARVASNPRYVFEKADIRDARTMRRIFEQYEPDGVLNLAAESHVDRSIDEPGTFIDTNVVGTYRTLEAALAYWGARGQPDSFRFLHVSTDEVYGSLGDSGRFTEATAYAPNSPYAASKASSDHLIRAWHQTFAFPAIVSNCSNKYGPFQFPEKLIPVVILNAINNKPIPVYGQGLNVRDWLYVDDHAAALLLLMEHGQIGSTYNIGGNSEIRNIDLVRTICSIIDKIIPEGAPHDRHIVHVPDRPGHDYRYAIDDSKIRNEIGWCPLQTLDEGLKNTVSWYCDNGQWLNSLKNRQEIGLRLGLGTD